MRHQHSNSLSSTPADSLYSYEGDDAAPSAPAAAPAPAATTTTEPAVTQQPESVSISTEQAPPSEPIANGSNVGPDTQSYANDGWNDQQQQGQQNWDYNNNNNNNQHHQGNDYSASQQNNHGDDDYKPIGIKEDG